MGASLTIEETNNPEDVFYVLSNPEVWDAITFGTEDIENCELPFGDAHIYLVTKKDGFIIGANYFQYLNPVMVEFHPSVLPVYRREYSVESVKLAIDWMFSTTDIQKVLVQIPSCFDHVIKFAHKIGFIQEGLVKYCYPRKDELVDLHILGMTRQEWADL